MLTITATATGIITETVNVMATYGARGIGTARGLGTDAIETGMIEIVAETPGPMA